MIRSVLFGLVSMGLVMACSRQPGPRVVSARVENKEVSYQVVGEGESTIVFVHGWASNRTFWAAQMQSEELAEGRRLIAVDLIGHGESAKPRTPYSLDLFVASVLAAMDEEGAERAVLVGHSNGVPVIRQLYRDHPERVAGLVIVDGPLRPPPGNLDELIHAMRGQNGPAATVGLIDGMLESVSDTRRRAWIREQMLSTPQHVMVGGFEAVSNLALWEEDGIERPVLAVYASETAWGDGHEAFVRGLIPHVEWHVVDRASHFLMIDAHEEFNRLLQSWLSRNGW